MIRKLLLLGLPLFFMSIQQIHAEERDPLLEQLKAKGRKNMEEFNQKNHISEYIQNNQFTSKARADLIKLIESYMYIMEHNAAKVPDAYKVNGLDPIEDGKSIPDTRSGLKGISYQLGPFSSTIFNKDPLRFKTVWSYAQIGFSGYYRNNIPFTISTQELSLMDLVFERINLMTDQADDVPQYRSYLYVYHSRKDPDVKVSFSVSQTNYNKNTPTILPKIEFIMISKGDTVVSGDRVLRTVYPH